MSDKKSTLTEPFVITPPGGGADLGLLAARMCAHLARTGQLVETYVQLPPPAGEDAPLTFQVILRPGPKNQIQLVTVGWGRHWPHALRAELCAAFGVPDKTLCHFNIIRGWQTIKWTWTLPPAGELREGQQLSLIKPDPDKSEPAWNNYRQEEK